jgi:hypothetical protein
MDFTWQGIQMCISCHTLICFTCLWACLHPLPGVAHLPHCPLCIYICVLCLSVASLSSLSSHPVFLYQRLLSSSLSFLILLVFDPCLSWPCTHPPDHSACPWACLPAVLYLYPTSGLLNSAWPDPEPACHPVPLPLLLQKTLLLRHSLHLGLTPWSFSPVFVIVSTPFQVSPIFPIIPCVFISVFSICLLPVRLLCQVNQRFCVSAWYLLVTDTLEISENQSVTRIELVRLLIMTCWMLVPLLFNGCVKLLDIGANWNTVVHVDSEHPQHSHRVSMQAMEELGHFQLPGIVFVVRSL